MWSNWSHRNFWSRLTKKLSFIYTLTFKSTPDGSFLVRKYNSFCPTRSSLPSRFSLGDSPVNVSQDFPSPWARCSVHSSRKDCFCHSVQARRITFSHNYRFSYLFVYPGPVCPTSRCTFRPPPPGRGRLRSPSVSPRVTTDHCFKVKTSFS